MLDRSLLDQARFHLDYPSLFGFSTHEENPDSGQVHSNFLSRHVQVSKSLFPDIANAIQRATAWLLGDKTVLAFISSDENINAACIPGPDNQPIIWLSSGLIKTLYFDELCFVIGHEVGHWYFRHYLYPTVNPDGGPTFAARQQLSRAAEISADRIGLISSGNLDIALKAVLKTASGLPDKYLGKRVSEFVTQARSIKVEKVDHGEVFATHPPMVIRARALLWFSMTDLYGKLSGEHGGGLSLDTVNKRVEKDLSTVLGKEYTKKQKEEIQEAVFWMTIFELTRDGGLSKEDQTLIKDEFGKTSLKKLKALLAGKSNQQVSAEMKDRAIAAKELIAAYSKQTMEQFLKEHSQVAAHAKRFIHRFH